VNSSGNLDTYNLLLCQWWQLRRDPFLQWADGLH
jgi:hypothetical protein